MTPFPRDDDRDINPQIDDIIEARLFEPEFSFRELEQYDNIVHLESSDELGQLNQDDLKYVL